MEAVNIKTATRKDGMTLVGDNKTGDQKFVPSSSAREIVEKVRSGTYVSLALQPVAQEDEDEE